MNTAHRGRRKPSGPSPGSDAQRVSRHGLTSQGALRPLLVACLFWTLCLVLTAAGHRLYKTVLASDRQVSSERYQADGVAVVWVGHGTIEEAKARVAESSSNRADEQVHALPNSSFWLVAMAAFTALGGFMAWSGQFVKHHGIQSLIGLFAGHFLWLGAVEFGLDAVGRRLGLCGALEVVEGRIVGTHGAGILIQMSVVFLVVVLFGIALHESNRCAMFQWFRRRLPVTRTPVATGRIDNYAARTTTQYVLTVWFCYVTVLWLADPIWGRLGEVLLLAAMCGIFVATPYMMWRTTRQAGVGQSLRYSISGAVVTWTGIEMAASMRLFEEPWLSTSALSGMFFLGITVVLTVWALVVLINRPIRSTVAQPLASLILAIALLGVTGCGASTEKKSASSPDEIETQLRAYNERIKAPSAATADALIQALTSDSPEMAAQAAVSFGNSGRVSPVVEQQLEAMAISADSRLSQIAALQALSRLELLSPRSLSIIDQLMADEAWADLAEYIQE